MPFDPNLPLIPKHNLIDTNRNLYNQGNTYHPGAIPAKWRTEEFCTNPIVKIDSPIAGENAIDLVELTTSPDKVGKLIDHDKLNINTCTIEQLIAIDGISTAAADKIVKDREAKGLYDSLQNLLERMPTLAKHSSTLEERFSFEQA
jgi:hypothetical protein